MSDRGCVAELEGVWNDGEVRLFAIVLIILTALPFGAGATRVIVATDASTPCTGCPGERAAHDDTDTDTDTDTDPDDHDRDRERCSPTCPDCVVSFATRLLTPHTPSWRPRPTLVAPTVLHDDDDEAPFDRVAGPPRAPPGDGVFHPPRV